MSSGLIIQTRIDIIKLSETIPVFSVAELVDISKFEKKRARSALYILLSQGELIRLYYKKNNVYVYKINENGGIFNEHKVGRKKSKIDEIDLISDKKTQLINNFLYGVKK